MKIDLHIRAVDTKIINSLDDIAKEKGISRSELIRDILKQYILKPELQTFEQNFQSLTEINVNVLKEAIEIISHIKEIINE